MLMKRTLLSYLYRPRRSNLSGVMWPVAGCLQHGLIPPIDFSTPYPMAILSEGLSKAHCEHQVPLFPVSGVLLFYGAGYILPLTSSCISLHFFPICIIVLSPRLLHSLYMKSLRPYFKFTSDIGFSRNIKLLILFAIQNILIINNVLDLYITFSFSPFLT